MGKPFLLDQLAALQEENARLRAEVRRLEGLILDWQIDAGEVAPKASRLAVEARRIEARA